MAHRAIRVVIAATRKDAEVILADFARIAVRVGTAITGEDAAASDAGFIHDGAIGVRHA